MAERLVHGHRAFGATGTQVVGDRQHVGGAPEVPEVSLHAAATAHASVLRALHDDHVTRRQARRPELLPLATLLQRCERETVCYTLHKWEMVCYTLYTWETACYTLHKWEMVCYTLHKWEMVCYTLHKWEMVCCTLHKCEKVCYSLHKWDMVCYTLYMWEMVCYTLHK